MPAPISVVIPTLNAADSLPRVFMALYEGVQEGLIRQVIVSDGRSSDLTLDIADDAGALILQGAPSRGGQLRRGCAAATSEWLLVLHADTELQQGWTAFVSQHLSTGQPACFRLRFRAQGMAPRIVAGWANLRSQVLGLPYGDQALLVRKTDYERAGGYPDQPLMEDVALVRALPAVTSLRCDAVTSAERYTRQGWLRRGARNLWTLTRYFLGADPQKLARAYRR
ncbi:TIGR04283 family arsenosugar biosynthesis glycosyltransferase [Ruegeria sp. HKCCD7255]|uniref:TIGR04283 family arsenosugar biosynthesis glycosyltransferase n=1 Tax=Ruegeria sp. HKCCD7255 TaxID=2683004 RepID=UPI001488701D